jgi:hypothetical protein
MASWSWLYGSWIYNYLCNQCLSPRTLWVRIPLMARSIWYNIMWQRLAMTCGRSVVFCGYSGFLHRLNWPPRYNWNMVESGVKHHTPNPIVKKTISTDGTRQYTNTVLQSQTLCSSNKQRNSHCRGFPCNITL